MLSQLTFDLTRRLYLGLPDMTLAASLSAAVSYCVNRHGRFSLPSPQTAATIAGCAVAGKYVLWQLDRTNKTYEYIELSKEGRLLQADDTSKGLRNSDALFSRWAPLACIVSFVGYKSLMLEGCEKQTLLSSALLTVASMLLSHVTTAESELPEAYKCDFGWVSELGKEMIEKAFKAIPKVAPYVGLVWGATRAIQAHGFDFALNPLHVFALSLLLVAATFPLARELNNGKLMFPRWLLCYVALAGAFTRALEPSLLSPSCTPFVLTCGAALACALTPELLNTQLQFSKRGLEIAGSLHKSMPLVALETALTSLGAAYISQKCGFSLQVGVAHALAISLLYHATDDLFKEGNAIKNLLQRTVCLLTLTVFIQPSLQAFGPFAKTFAVATTSFWLVRQSVKLLSIGGFGSHINKELFLLKAPPPTQIQHPEELDISVDKLGHKTLESLYTKLPNMVAAAALASLAAHVAQRYGFDISAADTASSTAALAALHYGTKPFLDQVRDHYDIPTFNNAIRYLCTLGLLSSQGPFKQVLLGSAALWTTDQVDGLIQRLASQEEDPYETIG